MHDCIQCGHEFEAKPWIPGACPKCGAGYSWDEAVDGEGNDWPCLVWDDDVNPGGA